MVMGFMSGLALGQQLVGMGRSKGFGTRKYNTPKLSHAQRLQSAKLAAYKRMQARQLIQRKNPQTAENMAFDAAFNYDFKDDVKYDPSGQLLNSFRGTLKDFNDWIKQKTNGILDLNMSMAIFFIIRGIRKFILEKQYPSAWQLIWWASSILRGWRFM